MNRTNLGSTKLSRTSIHKPKKLILQQNCLNCWLQEYMLLSTDNRAEEVSTYMTVTIIEHTALLRAC